MDVKLLHQIASISADGVWAETEQFSYVLSRLQLSNELQQFTLARGQRRGTISEPPSSAAFRGSSPSSR
jgi:hypothetical protein